MSDYIVFSDADKKALGDIAEGARIMSIRTLTRQEFDTWHAAILALDPYFEGVPESQMAPDSRALIST